MAEVNAKQYDLPLSRLVQVVEANKETVMIYDDNKVVAEIIPTSESRYRSLHNPGRVGEASESEYKTMGETLLRR
jgi:antitoxin (DNA-binding transcriptional repressor) of toxin-antitoxin stability system